MLVMSFVLIGSLICATATNTTIFIIGRAIAGVGAGGVFSGSLTITAYIVPLYRRPKFNGALTSLFGVIQSYAPFADYRLQISWVQYLVGCLLIESPGDGASILTSPSVRSR